ncbi:MAG: pyruvate synthase subunit beta [Chloroflexi bacterium]|nr:pyruvate synthase subunit beta [Chloroflexota bacterium]
MNTINAPLKYINEEYVQPPHTACPGCGMPLAMRGLLKALGSKVILVIPPGCGSIIGSYPKRIFRDKGENIPVLSTPLGSAAICAGGLKTALVIRGDTETEVVACVGDGGTYDIGFGGLSAIAERNEDIIYVCYDNELYGNTGAQRSSATPWGARTVTTIPPVAKMENKKDIISIMAAHGIPYLATATIAYPDDLMRKVRKAKDITGFRFLLILTPCVTGWLYRSEFTVEASRLAVETRIFPLLEIENGTHITINKQPEGIPVEEYFKIQGRYRHLTSEEIAEFQGKVDEGWKRLQWSASYGNQA